MSDAASLFFARSELNSQRTQRIVDEQLHGLDDGELFLEYSQSENLVFDDGRLKNASFNTEQGFGLRGVMGEATALAHSCELSEAALKRAGETVRTVAVGQECSHNVTEASFGTNRALYGDDNPLNELPFAEKLSILQSIDSYLREKDTRVKQVTASLSGVWQAVHIMRAGGSQASDIRPLVRLNINVVVEQNGRMETGSAGAGARTLYAPYLDETKWKSMADDALRRALTNLDAKPAPAGEFPVVIGPAWCGVLLHEAVGHGLEGDFNRKGSSTFAGRIGDRVAAPGVTVVDNGTMPDRRGSLSIDDEGTPTSETVLIEDGILKGYMQDRLNARLMGVRATGNGRRESYAHKTMPRMTNTYMLDGKHTPEEIIASLKRGVYAANFGGGQVDIVSGKFVFSASEAYWVEDGKIMYPIKGATLIGNGPEVMQKISMIGNDLSLDDGIGTCGKDGQSVPVGVGQPTLRIEGITVGGTQV
jgi:TldD protein